MLVADIFDQLTDLIAEIITDHWLKLLWIPFAAAGVWALKRYRDGRAWKRRQFLQRVNCSFNILERGALKIRTFFEVDLDAILLGNDAAVGLVLNAAQRTTRSDAFVLLPNEEYWHILNAILNEIAERCGVGTLAADMGIPVARAWYVFGLTCEKDDDVRVRKLRIMMIREELLKAIGSAEVPEPQFEHASHSIRWKTLQRMAEIERQHPERLMRVELVLPIERPVAAAEPTEVEAGPAIGATQDTQVS